MKAHIALLISLSLATPALAQEEENPLGEALDLFGEGARMLLEGLGDEMQPMLEEIRPFFEEDMLPFLQSLAEEIDDLRAYELPERLPNGDIIIRRRPDVPDPSGRPEIGEGGDVEL